jgi:hypothetical protein
VNVCVCCLLFRLAWGVLYGFFPICSLLNRMMRSSPAFFEKKFWALAHLENEREKQAALREGGSTHTRQRASGGTGNRGVHLMYPCRSR